MTSPERTGSDGVRAARALLSLVDEHSCLSTRDRLIGKGSSRFSADSRSRQSRIT
ncbi:uncharacterized protein SOCE26_035200 [Sorangium cellulosum]|uniref:Uncharacterized protein n=1 Tax=Sorangium cellulosum TaxID=56 RepID=A0A2L0ES15_SORCE|nr:uncharacterized protein SOCE26_035200 [Sorangium cellulosum]